MIVKVTKPDNFPISRQLSTFFEEENGIRFVINQNVKECDYWIVYDNLLKEETVLCSPENTMLITGEPSSVKVYNHSFLKQFAKVITTQKLLCHSNKIYSQPALPWLVGIDYIKEKGGFQTDNCWTYKDFVSFKPHKTKLVSVVTSNKAFTKGHRLRLDFVSKLKVVLGQDLDVFGEGFLPVKDKMDALRDYKYTIVIENSKHDHYWTEKLADAFLCGCMPIYYGCDNVKDYFSQDSLVEIDITKSEAAIQKVVETINSDRYHVSKSSIEASKKQILEDYNFFSILKKNDYAKARPKIACTIKPERLSFFDKVISKFLRAK